MNIRFNLLTIIGLASLFAACGGKKHEAGDTVDEQGFSMKYLASYENEPGNMGDIIEFDLLQTFKGQVLVNTFQLPDYRVRAILKQPEFETDYMKGLLKMGVDDSVLIAIDLASMPAESIPKGFENENGTMEFTIKVRNIWNENQVIDAMVNQLSDNHPETWKKTAHGVRVFWDEEGTGPKVEFGDSVRIHVKGLFPSGAVFMSTHERDPITFLMGEGIIIPQAWEEACSLASVGDKLTVIAPYEMAFGEVDRKPILKYSTLVFEIDVVDLVKNI